LGLDVYVGPMCRYYSCTWETIVQQAAKQQGMNVVMSRPPGFNPPSPEQALGSVRAWQTGVSEKLGSALSWDESSDGEYFTDKPDWDGYHALRYLALDDEFPGVQPPKRISSNPDPADLDREPLELRFGEVYMPKPQSGRRGLAGILGRRSTPTPEPRYWHVEVPGLWIPADFPMPFHAPDAAGNPVIVGSVPRFRAELEGLNDRTLRASPEELARLRQPGPPRDGNFADLSRFALAIFLGLVREADTRRLPMILDY
jgi:hypothetical protein